MIGNPSLKRG